MLKRISLIGIMCAVLAACGGGSGGGTTRSTVNPQSAYGNLIGPAVPYTGELLPFYQVNALQGLMVTSPAITDLLGGVRAFGVCNGLQSNDALPGKLGKILCLLNQKTINSDPNFSAIFTGGFSGVNVGNFVVKGAAVLGITSVQPYRIMYDTAGGPYQFAGGATDPQTVSGAVLVPEVAGVPLAESQIKGVLLFFHPTTISKGGVPSDFDGDLTPNNTQAGVMQNRLTAFAQDSLLAAVYAAQGYIVVAPDYVGQGANYKVQHPYVIYPQTNAQSGLNALKAARTALAAQGVILPKQTKLYISSYSEGGAYALWASQLAQTSYADFLSTNGFSLRRTFGVSGVYDLTGATLHFEFANANNSPSPESNVWNVSPGLVMQTMFADFPPDMVVKLMVGAKVLSAVSLAASKTALAGYVLTALAYYNSSPASLNVLAPRYSQMTECLDVNIADMSGSYLKPGNTLPQASFVNCPLPYNLAALYNTPGLTQTDIANQSFAAATATPQFGPDEYLAGSKTFLDLKESLALGYTNNSVASFVQPGILDDPTITTFVEKGNIQSWVTNSPIDILFLNYDSTVSNINALEACGNLPESANFPGYQPNYVGGVKQQSAPGMVTCLNLANNGVDGSGQLYTQESIVPLMIDHGQAEAVLQLMALNQIVANP